jgi:glycosyltransferase involved in cell wall biosynthesis
MDGRMLDVRGTGVATYAQGLRRAQCHISEASAVLVASGDRSPLRRLAAASWPGAVDASVAARTEGGPSARFESPDLYRRAHVHFSLYRRLLRLRVPGPCGIMHWTYPVPLVVEGWCNIYTIHDLIPLERPDLSSISAARLRAVLRQISKRASRIVTVSEAARQVIDRSGLFAAHRLVDCGQVVEPVSMTPGALPLKLAPGGYLLWCGSVEPRKNLVRLLRAYTSSGCPQPLVIVGPDGWKAAPIRAEIARTPNVLSLPYVPRDDLVRLMANARALLFPSHAEGFGLPLAEAMALGVPTLASDIPAHREVARDAALFADPLSIEAMSAAIVRLAQGSEAIRALVERGRIDVARYGLANFTHRLSSVYQAAFAEHMACA